MKRSKPSKPIQIQHHRVRNLPSIEDVVDYVPVARSLNDSNVASVKPVKVNIPQEIGRHEWQADGESKVCMRCRAPFSGLWRRRHHCRMCGQLVCSSCSQNTRVGYAHHLENNLLVTSLDAPIYHNGSSHRVCVSCGPKLELLDRAYFLVKVLAIAMNQRSDIAFQGNAFHLFRKLACVSKEFYIATLQLKKILVSSQYIYGHPWNLDFKPRNSHKFVITKCLLSMMKPYVSSHEFYRYALQYHDIPPIKLGANKLCKELLCRNLSHTTSMEVDMTNLFVQHKDIEWTLELAKCLTPTLLWKKRVSTLTHLVQRYKEAYIPHLFVWLHAFPFGAGYVDQFRKIIPIHMFQRLHENWDFFYRLCEVARTCKDNTKDPRFVKLAMELAQNHYHLPGHMDLQIVSLDVWSANFCQANSSSKPFILPCRIYHKDSNTYSKEKILIKHRQSMGSDGFVHLWIEYMKTLIPNSSTITTYPSIPIGSYSGLILMVPNSITLSNLTKASGIHNKLYDAAHNAHVSRAEINKTFAQGVAFFTILTCFIGLRDRIASNTMLLPEQNTIFDIDYEYMFNKQPPMKETIRNVGNFLDTWMHSSSSSSSSSYFMEMSDGDTIVMKPVLPDCVMSMLGGQESYTYTSSFVPKFNTYFQLMWNHRHVLYFASRFLTFFPSTTQASQLTTKEHDMFFAELANVVLQDSDTYGEFACKVVLSKDQSRPWTEKVLDRVSKWSRGSKSR